MIYELLIQNKEFLKLLYGLFIVLLCATIFFKTDKLFRLSFHQGIRYFRNAFLFFTIAFLIRYVLASEILNPYLSGTYSSLNIFFEFFLIMGGFFLLYSLLWKKVENSDSASSLFNPGILLFYAMTIIIIIFDYVWSTYFFMFFSQIVLFVFAVAISYTNFTADKSKHKFLKLYFIAMVFSLTVWVLNAFALYFQWNLGIVVNVYAINTIVFLLFLFGVIKVTAR